MVQWNFDSDLEKELDERRIINGGKRFLDLFTILFITSYASDDEDITLFALTSKSS